MCGASTQRWTVDVPEGIDCPVDNGRNAAGWVRHGLPATFEIYNLESSMREAERAVLENSGLVGATMAEPFAHSLEYVRRHVLLCAHIVNTGDSTHQADSSLV